MRRCRGAARRRSATTAPRQYGAGCWRHDIHHRHQQRGRQMNASTKLAAYGAGVLAVFGAAFGIGSAAEPIGLANAEPAEHTGSMDMGDGLPGLASTAAGFTLVPNRDVLAAGIPARYQFEIADEDGTTVTDFDVEHT